MRPASGRLQPSRRGVTLLEMLVAVALLVLMMSVLVLVFSEATGAIQEQRAYAALDQELRRLDSLIRSDLNGVTARMTPPNNPDWNSGYFEYAENALADAQGEDGDDTLRFTAQAPPGQPFVGRIWLPRSVPLSDPGFAAPASRGVTYQPVKVTSQYAEIVYFLRNGNLYRRVFLITPERAGQLGVSNFPNDPKVALADSRAEPSAIGFISNEFRPIDLFAPGLYPKQPGSGLPVISWLGMNSVSARPSKFPLTTPAFNILQAYAPIPNTLADLTSRENRAFNPRHADDFVNNAAPGTAIPDNRPDDENDLDGNTTVYEGDGVPDYPPVLYPNLLVNGLINERDASGALTSPAAIRPATLQTYDAMAFPYVYPNSYSQPSTGPFGGYHNPDPSVPATVAGRPYFGTFLDPPYNHNPLDLGDSLPTPGSPQTWWGFPTWRETASPYWLDPVKRVNDPSGAPYFSALPGGVGGVDSGAVYQQSPGLSFRTAPGGSRFLLPPMTGTFNTVQPYNDGAGTPYFGMPPSAVWDEDLIATNVRSFDVKALDVNPKMINPANGGVVNLPPGYYDLGYANLTAGTLPVFLDSFAHEGRMPPLTTDYRSDAQFPALLPNIGDDAATVVRLRRVWDSWSTTYTASPAMPLLPYNGPLGGLPPVYPSYPAPYPAPLRGIQIQIRLADPDDQRIKLLTIKHDFTDKL